MKRLLVAILTVISVCYSKSNNFEISADYGRPFSAYVLYEEASKQINNCMIMIPENYSYHYFNSEKYQSVTLTSINAYLEIENWEKATKDPTFSFQAFLDNSDAKQKAMEHIDYVKTTSTIYKSAESATFGGHLAYRVAFLNPQNNIHHDYFYFTKDEQCFKFGYSVSNLNLTQNKEDSILIFLSNAIFFHNETGVIARNENPIEKNMPQVAQVGDLLHGQELSNIKVYNALGKQLSAIPAKARGLYFLSGKYKSKPIVERIIAK